jgi:hypothetical protein
MRRALLYPSLSSLSSGVDGFEERRVLTFEKAGSGRRPDKARDSDIFGTMSYTSRRSILSRRSDSSKEWKASSIFGRTQSLKSMAGVRDQCGIGEKE